MQQNIKTQKLIYDAKKEEPLNLEYSLQEYLPGISRIIKAFIHVKDCRFVTEASQAFADTELHIDVVYLSDFGGKIKCAAFEESIKIPFKDSFSHDGEYTAFPSVYCLSLSASPVTLRKIKLKGILQARCSVYSCNELSLYNASENEVGICVLGKAINVCESFSTDSGIMSVQSEVALESTSPPAGEIVYSRADIHSARAQMKEGRLVVDAMLSMYALYECAQTENTEEAAVTYAAVSSNVPFSADVTDLRLNENQKYLCCADVYSALCSCSFDSYGESKIPSFDVKYILRITAFEEKQVQAALDAFSTSFALTNEPQQLQACSIKGDILSKQAVKETVHADLNGLSEISACFVKICSVTKEKTAEKHFAVTKCLLEVMGTNLSGELVCIDAPVTFHVPITDDCPDSAQPCCILSVSRCSCAVKDGYIEVEAEFDICGLCKSVWQENVLKSITPDTSSQISKSKGEITVVYPTSEDTVWSIAKKHLTSPEEIRSLNGIAEDCEKPSGIIIIS